MIQRSRLMELMSYDPATGQFVWLIGRRNHRPAGSEAGYRRKDGYIVLVIEGKHYLAHRIAYITKNRRQRKLGYFTKKSEAVKVRRAAEAAMFGEFVRTN